MESSSFRLVKSKNILRELIYFILIIAIVIVIGIVIINKYKHFKIENEKILKASNYCNNVREEIKSASTEDVEECLVLLTDTKQSEIKQTLLKEYNEVKEYTLLRDEIQSYFVNDVLVSNISLEQIDSFRNKSKNIKQEFLDLLSPLIEEMEIQYSEINTFKNVVEDMYETSSKENVRKDLTREDYNKSVEAYNDIKQENLKNEYIIYINKAEQYLINKEKIEEERKRQEAINQAWIKLNVPYISQNLNYVYNGCEAASVLMALKYKGYLQNMDIVTYAENMPKSNDPNTGFYLDIFGVEPKTESHWIAPAPLTQYAISSSNNQNIINSTGWDLSQITNEILNNNAVVVYLTYDFKEPSNWSNGAPNNLHVQLLTGYNTITKQYLVTDPYTRGSGKYEFIISEQTMGYLYNSVGNRSVVVR